MKSIKHRTINYRNGIYQGPYNSRFNFRSGFGIIYNLNNHSIIASNWKED